MSSCSDSRNYRGTSRPVTNRGFRRRYVSRYGSQARSRAEKALGPHRVAVGTSNDAGSSSRLGLPKAGTLRRAFRGSHGY